MTQATHLLYLSTTLPLAAGALADAWRNGSVFAGRRAVAEATLEADVGGPRGLLAKLVSCDFCLGHHVPWVLLLSQYLPACLLEATPWGRWANLALLPSYSLAATRVAWLLNGLLPGPLQYDRKFG